MALFKNKGLLQQLQGLFLSLQSIPNLITVQNVLPLSERKYKIHVYLFQTSRGLSYHSHKENSAANKGLTL